jgi:hypothetical protein
MGIYIVEMAKLEWIDEPHSVNIIKEHGELPIKVGDCINFTNLVKNRAGKIIHHRTIRAEIDHFKGDEDIKIFVRKLGGGKRENIENIGEEIEIHPESYESITHAGCAFRKSGGSKRRRRTKRRRYRDVLG